MNVSTADSAKLFGAGGVAIATPFGAFRRDTGRNKSHDAANPISGQKA